MQKPFLYWYNELRNLSIYSLCQFDADPAEIFPEKSWMSELFVCPEKLFKLCLSCLQITPLSVSSRESNNKSYLRDPNCGFKGLHKFNSMQNQTRSNVCSQWWSLVKSLLCQIKIWSCPALPAALCHWLRWDDRAIAVSHSGSQTSSNSKIENKWSRNIQITVRLSSFHQNLSQTHWRKKVHCKKNHSSSPSEKILDSLRGKQQPWGLDPWVWRSCSLWCRPVHTREWGSSNQQLNWAGFRDFKAYQM